MKATKYLYTMIAAAGMSFGTIALANETPGTQSRCAMSDASGGIPLEAFNLTNTDASEAFCVGLQSHGDASSAINFAGYLSSYTGKDNKKIMAKGNIEHFYAGHGSRRCVTDDGLEACDHDQNSALKLDVTDYPHPDYLPGDDRILATWEVEDFPPGVYADLIGGYGGKINFISDPLNPNNSTYHINKLTTNTYGEIHLTAGDYYIESLQMGHSGKIIVDGPGTARLFLKNTPSWWVFNEVNWLSGSDGTQDPSKLVIILDSDLETFQHNSVSISAYIYAKGRIRGGGYTTLVGAVNAQNIILWDSAQVIEDLSTVANVDFGNITAIPAPYDDTLIVIAPEDPGQNRHSGTYPLKYSYESLEPDNDDTLAWVDIHVVGAIQVGNFGLAYGGAFALQIGSEVYDFIEERNEKDIEYSDLWVELGDYPPNCEALTIPCYNTLVSGSWATIAERQVEKDKLKSTLTETINTSYKTMLAEYETAVNDWIAQLPPSITYQTFYLGEGGSSSSGFAASQLGGVNNGGGGFSVMNDNLYLTPPIEWPYLGFFLATPPTPFGIAFVGCKAALHAAAWGCFARDENELCHGEEGSCTNECNVYSDQSPVEGYPVDLAMNVYASNDLTCVAGVFPFLSVMASVGAGVRISPYAELDTKEVD